MGFEIAALIVGSVLIGNYFDEKYQTRGLIVVGLIVICFIGWLARVLFLLARIQKAEEKEERRRQ